jgi:tetratricopeptide (TPR) repeat protein
MALFGFNKQKTLANAEKYVQQGKIQNAITEYEKVLKADPKDLTVNNTVGDLYSRLGESDKATDCFKSVGDAYASQGFTVKAIAMYKKISKLKPSLESLLKLAELYTQQGLFNDARAQYLQVADEFLKSGELENAVRIFQKILEMDPENVTMRIRLAEVYVRLGKKTEAWQIFSAAAESQRSRGQLAGAEEILQRMLTLDPGNAYALLMQGKNQVESGDAAGAVATLTKIGDIDSNPDGLRDLLKAYLKTGQLSEAGAAANKLLTVHNDLSAIALFADALMQAGQYENALQLYDQHAERLLAENSDKVLEHLHSIIGHVRDNPDSLQKLLDLFHKAGETTHISEVSELLAHASVQSGDLPRARDLYQKLSQIEPQNTLHMQNYQQVVSQLNGTTGTKLITPEEAVVLVDDLEATAPSIHQHYSDETALAVRSALTDAELFISYNMPAKALGPLLGALPMAPSDLRINQRLAALHTRAGRFAEAAGCCRTLQSVFSEADHPEEATRYGELAQRYEERSTVAAPIAAEEAPIYIETSGPAEAEESAEEFSIDAPAADASADAEEAIQEEAEDATAEDAPAHQAWPTAHTEAAPVEAEEEISVEPANEFAVVDESAAVEEPATEIDLSSEWDDSLTVETDAPASDTEITAIGDHDTADSSKVDDTIEEIRFYIANNMHEQAMAALAKLQTVTSDENKIAQLRAEVETAVELAAEQRAQAEAEPAIEEITVEDIPSSEVAMEEAAAAIEETPAEEPAVEELTVAAPAITDHAIEETAVEEPAEIAPEVAVVEAVPAEETPAAKVPVAAVEPKVPAVAASVVEATEAPGALKDFVTDLESSLGDSFLPGTVAQPATLPAPIRAAKSAAAAAATTSAPVLGEFVADIEASLGNDFLKAAPVPQAPAAVPVTAQAAKAPTPAPIAAAASKIPQPLAASAAASAATTATHQVAPARVAPVSPVAPAAWPAPDSRKPAAPPVAQTPVPPPPAAVAQVAPVVPAPAAAKSSPFGEEAGVDLAEMFGELRHDLESDVASADEDPETHYNLGIAFREMGLLDEAIGELQKACQAFDRGHQFPQIMQTYTWLAQCFLEKSVPEAAIRWYEKALQVPTIDGETRVALNYELAAAFETAGDKPAALKHFMDVYGTNIDYRDVAERIKALKS